MKKVNAEKFNMMLTVFLTVNGAQLIWQNLAAFADAFSRFSSKLTDIENADEDVQRITTGVTPDKRQKRAAMASFAMLVKGAVQAYATKIADHVTFQAVNYSRYKIIYGKSATSLAHAKTICDTANALINQLSPYGITPQTITDFKAVITAFEQSISAPRKAITDRAVAGKLENQLISEASQILLNEMDKLMESFKHNAPSFYITYFQSRKICNIATHFTKFSIDVTYQANDQPVYGAAVTVQSPTSGKEYKFTSNLSGTAQEKVTHGIYNITVAKPGHPSVTLDNVEIKLGQQKNLLIKIT